MLRLYIHSRPFIYSGAFVFLDFSAEELLVQSKADFFPHNLYYIDKRAGGGRVVKVQTINILSFMSPFISVVNIQLSSRHRKELQTKCEIII